DMFDEGIENAVYLNANKQAMIPARDIIEQFGGKVSYNQQSNSYILFDRATDTTIEISAGSNIAIVNGEKVEWSSPVEIKDGRVFVPARALSEALQADIFWYNWGGL